MSKIVVSVAFIAGALFSFQASAGTAISPMTDAMLANVRANASFLDLSGKLASSHSRSAAVRHFAKSEISEAIRIADLLDGVAPATAADDTAGKLVTGRSAAVEGEVSMAANEAANGRPALGRHDVETLSRLSGRTFDDALWTKQLDALSQLRADYTAYAADGDDQVLVALAKRELPKVEARLAALSRI